MIYNILDSLHPRIEERNRGGGKKKNLKTGKENLPVVPFLHSKEIFFQNFFLTRQYEMPESENGAILWALIRILTTLLGRFRNLFDRPGNEYSPYLKVKCSTFQ